MENSYSKVISKENMPIDPERLCGQFSEMVHDITCQICLNIIYPQPVCCAVCQKMFCKKCIDQWVRNSFRNTCPNAHEYKEVQVNLLAKNLLENILLTCPNFKKGCKIQVKYGNYLRHLDSECEFIYYTCNGCNLVDKKKIILMHVNICDEINEKCGY
jgi:hypothetical protein